MDRGDKIILGSTVTIAVIILIIVLWPTIQASATTTTTGGLSDLGKKLTGGNKKNTVTDQLDENKLLQKGSIGEEVKALQLVLNRLEKSYPLDVDGKFGKLTEAKLLRLTTKIAITLKELNTISSAYALTGK